MTRAGAVDRSIDHPQATLTTVARDKINQMRS